MNLIVEKQKDEILTIVFQPIFHNKLERIALQYKNVTAINKVTRQLPGAKWSQTQKYWHVPLNKAVTAKAITALTPFGTIDLKPLKNFLTKRKLVQNTQVKEKPSALTEVQTLVYNKISNHNLGELNRMVETLKLKAYSQSIIKITGTK